jgi:hypothetical protein
MADSITHEGEDGSRLKFIHSKNRLEVRAESEWCGNQKDAATIGNIPPQAALELAHWIIRNFKYNEARG